MACEGAAAAKPTADAAPVDRLAWYATLFDTRARPPRILGKGDRLRWQEGALSAKNAISRVATVRFMASLVLTRELAFAAQMRAIC